jgi:hypothetical protein
MTTRKPSAAPATEPAAASFTELDIARLNAQGKRKGQPTISPSTWHTPDRVGYVKWVETVFRPLRDEMTVETLDLFPYQRFVRDYMQHKSPYRGLLLYHGLGAGKTRAAIATAEILLNEKQVVVLLPASLKQGFIDQIQMYGHKYYTPYQHWIAVPAKSIARVSDIKTVPHALIKKHKRLWVATTPSAGLTPNFASFGDKEQSEIREQLTGVIESRYQFINYRGGLNMDKIRDMQVGPSGEAVNPFDNKVVIVDEAHNLISQVANGKRIAGGLYDMLMRARDAKFILLSGTPMINHVHEIALMLNLVRGYETMHVVKYRSEGKSPDEIKALLEAHPRVHRVNIDSRHGVARIELHPGHIRSSMKPGEAHLVRYDVYMRDEDVIHELQESVAGEGVTLDVSSREDEHYLALPSTQKEFDAYFVDHDKIKNAGLFMRRILGTVSYLSAPANLPRVNEGKADGIQVVEVPMSDYQLAQYLECRSRERKQEETARKRRQRYGNEDSSANVYLAFSRAVINFTFPDTLERPYPSKIRMMRNALKAELDELDAAPGMDGAAEEEAGEGAAADLVDEKTAYARALATAMSGLDANADDYLRRNLRQYSPKYHAIMKRIRQCPGTALYYSQFREVEGLGILGKIMIANGYAPLKLRSENGVWEIAEDEEDGAGRPFFASYTSDKTLNSIILAIYNSDTDAIPPRILEQLKRRFPKGVKNNLYGQQMKLLMITQSGAEGINLKNVREVHIMEPYWNQVRVDQVMGRAIRSGSHLALPEKDRNVDVFMYVATFTPQQLRENFTLQRKDDSMTSDQAIYAIAARKAKIIKEILELLKRAAVDCRFNHSQHPNVACFSYPSNLEEAAFGREPHIHQEPLDVDYAKRLTSVKLQLSKVTIKGVAYVYVDSKKELYSYDTYVRTGELEFIGHLERMPGAAGYFRLRKVVVAA